MLDMFFMLDHQTENVPISVFAELLMAHTPVLHISANTPSFFWSLPPARITGDYDATTEMVEGAGLENEFVGVRYGK